MAERPYLVQALYSSHFAARPSTWLRLLSNLPAGCLIWCGPWCCGKVSWGGGGGLGAQCLLHTREGRKKNGSPSERTAKYCLRLGLQDGNRASHPQGERYESDAVTAKGRMASGFPRSARPLVRILEILPRPRQHRRQHRRLHHRDSGY